MTPEIATLLLTSPLFVLLGFIFVSDFKVQKQRNALYRASQVEHLTEISTGAKEL